MGKFTVLGGLIIKCLVVGLPLIFLLLLFRKNKSKLSTLFILLFFLLTSANAIYFLVSAHERKIEVSKKYLGSYKLKRLDCKECENCKIILHPNYTYDIIKNEKVIGEGQWDLEINSETGYFLKLDNGPNYMMYDTSREVESIDRKNCCVAGCNENLQEEFSGKIVDIKVDGYHFNQKTIFIQISNGDIIKYYPKYFAHPWIEDKLQIGEYFSKRKQSMNFTIVHIKGDTTHLNYKTPNCETACDTDKLLSDFAEELDQMRK